MATVLERAFGSIISSIAYCFYLVRDTTSHHKSVHHNDKHKKMPKKGRPLSLQVRYIDRFYGPKYFCFMNFLFLFLVSNISKLPLIPLAWIKERVSLSLLSCIQALSKICYNFFLCLLSSHEKKK